MNAQKEDPKHVVNRFAWVANDVIKLISEDGIEKLLRVDKGFEELEFNRIPNYDPELCKKKHVILDQDSPAQDDTLTRLQTKYQQYRTAYYLDRKLKFPQGKNDKENNQYLNDVLYNVDFCINNCKERFMANLSFTFLHWRLLEQLLEEKLEFSSVDKN